MSTAVKSQSLDAMVRANTMITRRKLSAALATIVGTTVTRAPAGAQDYPTQVIKLIIPNPPAGPGDVIARHFADRASRIIGQQFVFDYRAGASTTIGTHAAAKAPPDGYTIIGFPSSGLAITLLRKTLTYDLERDFRPIIGLGSVPLALIVKASLQYESFSDFEAGLRKGTLFYGSGGVGTIAHLSGAWAANLAGGSASHIPFRGNPDVVRAIISGNLDFTFASVADAAAMTGRPELKVLAVTSRDRFPGMPDVPTTAELGHAEFDSRLWYAFLAPAKVPADRIKRLFDAFAEVAKNPTLQTQLSSLGFKVDIQDADALAILMRDESVRWRRVIDANKITIED